MAVHFSMQKQNRNIVREAISLFQQLQQRRAELQREISEIDEALTQIRGGSGATAPNTVRSGVHSSGKKVGLRDMVITALTKGPLSRAEILQEVQNLGYRFNSKNPSKSLDVFLYGAGKALIKRVDGKFSLAGRSSGNRADVKNGAASFTKRSMSPEARKKIGAAQKAR